MDSGLDSDAGTVDLAAGVGAGVAGLGFCSAAGAAGAGGLGSTVRAGAVGSVTILPFVSAAAGVSVGAGTIGTASSLESLRIRVSFRGGNTNTKIGIVMC